MTSDVVQRLWDLPDALKLFEHLGNTAEPLRLPDLSAYIRTMGLPEPRLPGGATLPKTFLAAPIRHRGERVGNIFLGKAGSESAFSAEDEEILAMFASQAALVIANARRYRDEQRARNNLETLINTSPVGVVVCDAESGVPVSFNQEARRIVSSLQMPGRPTELEEIAQETLANVRPLPATARFSAADRNALASTAFGHLCELAKDVGWRQSATQEEAKAAELLIDRFTEFGYSPETQEFEYG